jgi:hypothetical protein
MQASCRYAIPGGYGAYGKCWNFALIHFMKL